MAEPKFTPGPWEIDPGADGDVEVAHFYGWEVTGPPQPHNKGQFAKRADAVLIAAAPDMYAALERIEYLLSHEMIIAMRDSQDEDIDEAIAVARCARALALGGE